MPKTVRLRLTVWTILATLMVAIPFAIAQTSGAEEPTREQLQLQISIMQEHIKNLEAELANRPENAELEQAYIEAKKKEYEYQIAIMDENISALRAQGWASTVILCLVVLVVVAGTVFAGFQLWKSVSVGGVQASSDLEVSASKVRVTSSVVGVVVLTISLVFLYIYTTEIYRISYLAPPGQEAETKSSK